MRGLLYPASLATPGRGLIGAVCNTVWSRIGFRGANDVDILEMITFWANPLTVGNGDSAAAAIPIKMTPYRFDRSFLVVNSLTLFPALVAPFGSQGRELIYLSP